MPSNPYRPSYRICASLPQAHLSGSSPRVTGACPHRLAYTTSPAKMTAATIVIAHSCPRVIRRKVKESRASVSSGNCCLFAISVSPLYSNASRVVRRKTRRYMRGALQGRALHSGEGFSSTAVPPVAVARFPQSAYVRPVGVLSGLSSTRDGNGCGHSTGQFDNVPVHGVFDGD